MASRYSASYCATIASREKRCRASAAAALHILSDRARWQDMSSAAAADARHRFSRDAIVAQYEALYRDAIEGGPSV